ncbi:PepSY domain-containing protein, partial [Pseudomonas sp. RTS4]|nr:PepSY domain-containing protein [Pseudomonas sp. RTS4]
MTWTGVWGKQFADVWNTYPAVIWNDVPKSDQLAGALKTPTRQTVPWALENTPMPLSGEHAEHMNQGSAVSMPANPTLSLQ